MDAIGWALIVAAAFLHFSICEWDSGSPARVIVGPIFAREQFAEKDRFGKNTGEYNIMGAAFWGLVIPVGMTGLGVSLINRGKTNKAQE